MTQARAESGDAPSYGRVERNPRNATAAASGTPTALPDTARIRVGLAPLTLTWVVPPAPVPVQKYETPAGSFRGPEHVMPRFFTFPVMSTAVSPGMYSPEATADGVAVGAGGVEVGEGEGKVVDAAGGAVAADERDVEG